MVLLPAGVTVTVPLSPCAILDVPPPVLIELPHPIAEIPAPSAATTRMAPQNVRQPARIFLRGKKQSAIRPPTKPPGGIKSAVRTEGDGVASDAVWTSVAIVSVAVTGAPAGVTVVGEKVHVEFAGNPEQVNCRASLNPPTSVMVRIAGPDAPAAMVSVAGLAVIVKSGAGFITSCTVRVAVAYAAVSVGVNVKLSVAVPGESTVPAAGLYTKLPDTLDVASSCVADRVAPLTMEALTSGHVLKAECVLE